MTCLSGHIARMGEGLQGEIRSTVETLSGIVRLGDALAGSAALLTSLGAQLTDLLEGRRLTGTVGLVCELNVVEEFLDVSPADVQWITDDVGVFFTVKSNVDWTIE